MKEKAAGLRANKVVSLVAAQRESSNNRIAKYHEIRDSTAKLINEAFRQRLKKGKNWPGKLEVDYEQERVDLWVAPHKGALSSSVLAC